MCYSCYEEYECPKIHNAKVYKAVDLIGKVYDWHLCGGSLHVAIDDWNLEDETLDFCARWMIENKRDIEDGRFEVEKECLDFMKQMTVDERATALAIYDGFLERSSLD